MPKENESAKETNETVNAPSGRESVERKRTPPAEPKTSDETRTTEPSGEPASVATRERAGQELAPTEKPHIHPRREDRSGRNGQQRAPEEPEGMERFTEAGDLVSSGEPDVLLDVKDVR
jgi:hypothetical protein